MNRVGSFLYRCRADLLRPDVGFYESGGSPLALGTKMEYAIAGIIALFLFAYLMYALLRPERF